MQVRRPAQFTYLSDYNLSLKELGTLVNSTYMDSHISYCVQCKDGGELLCCDGCPAAYHPTCLGLTIVPDGSWFCPSCVQVSASAGCIVMPGYWLLGYWVSGATVWTGSGAAGLLQHMAFVAGVAVVAVVLCCLLPPRLVASHATTWTL